MEDEEMILTESRSSSPPTLPGIVPQPDRGPIVYQQESNTGSIALLGMLGLGGLAAYLLLKERNQQTITPPNHGHEGHQGISYGGGELQETVLNQEYALMGHFLSCGTSLGFIFVNAANTDSMDFNSQSTFWTVSTVAGKLLLLDELERIWILKTGSDAVKNADGTYHVDLATAEEKQEILGLLADGNVAGILDNIVPYADWSVSYSASNGYTFGAPKVYRILFPQPLNTGDPANLSVDSSWLMKEAQIEITPIKLARNNGMGFKRTHIKIKVSIPGVITYTYMIPGKKANYFNQHLAKICITHNVYAYNMLMDHQHTPFQYSGQDSAKAKAFKRAIAYWGGNYGFFGRGRVAISNLCSGISGLRNSAVVWTAQWLNGEVDVTDLGHTFQNLAISPKAVALAELPSDMAAFQDFCYAWLTSTTDGNLPKLTGAVLRPGNLVPFTFISDEEIEAMLVANASDQEMVIIS